MNEFQEKLKAQMDTYVHFVYKHTKLFPKEELYNATSQFRRAALSIILNYVEGYARRKPLVRLNFLETSYGSLMESDYLADFSLKEGFLSKDNYDILKKLSREIGAMLWTEIKNLDSSCK